LSFSIHEKYRTPGTEIGKGDELGIFQFGGSSIIVAFQKDRIKFDDDLRDCSGACIQVSVEVGMSFGEATSSSHGQVNGAGQASEEGHRTFADVVKE
jgi:phosphatidylserine decarboxylase